MDWGLIFSNTLNAVVGWEVVAYCLAAIGLNGEGQTRTCRTAIDQHGACATHTVFTTDMSPG